ncbi:hypothetical protein V8J88_05385 [Massilia sp. W12]|uniref:hypothetical protein n=1 Tax=Massilia sp. W12 TaxID=3126507 RepID=UPI0030CABF0B
MVFDIRIFDQFWNDHIEIDGGILSAKKEGVNFFKDKGEKEGFFQKLLFHGMEKLVEDYGGGVNLDGYWIMMWEYPIKPYCCISFVPKIDWNGGAGFQIPKAGVWKNGPGVSYYYDYEKWELMRKVRMR